MQFIVEINGETEEVQQYYTPRIFEFIANNMYPEDQEVFDRECQNVSIDRFEFTIIINRTK